MAPGMATPSDLAPLGKIFDPTSNEAEPVVLRANQVQFNVDGSLTITFFGIKNDAHRTGFEIRIPEADNAKVDPVKTLKDYMDRTADIRGPKWSGVHRFEKATCCYY